MQILAIDTCWHACSVALVKATGEQANETLFSKCLPMTTGQAEALPVMLSELFKDTAISPSDIDRIAVTNGPGSFTGIRVGIAAARALHLASNADIVGCSSLAVIAKDLDLSSNDQDDGDILVAMDARRGEAYVQAFNVHDRNATMDVALLSIDGLDEVLNGAVPVIAGSAARLISERFAEGALGQATLIENVFPRAEVLAHMTPNLGTISGSVSPMYLRPPDAKPSTKPGIQRVQQ